MPENIFLIVTAALCGLNFLLLLLLLMRKNNTSKSDEKLEELLRQNDSLSIMVRTYSEATKGEIERAAALEERRAISLRKDLNESLSQIYELMRKLEKENSDGRLEMLRMVTGELEKIRNANEGQSERLMRILSQSIERLQLSNETKLEEMRKTVGEKLDETLGSRLDNTFKSVSDQLQKVYTSLGEMKELSSGVTTNVTSLSRILTNVKARGTWAEIQLEGILDQTIPSMYDKNVVTDPSGSERVEFAVRIPSGDDKESFIYLPIDSKFPVEDYIRLCEAADIGDTEGIAAARKALERRVLDCAREIRKYIHEPETTPFAIMYLATEGLYSEIISSKSGLVDRLHNEYGIMVSGPSTITALLNSLSMGFRAIEISEKAKDIRTTLAAVKSQYDKFGEVLASVRKKLNAAGTELEKAESRNGIIQRKLKNIESIDSAAADELLGLNEPDGIDL